MSLLKEGVRVKIKRKEKNINAFVGEVGTVVEVANGSKSTYSVVVSIDTYVDDVVPFKEDELEVVGY